MYSASIPEMAQTVQPDMPSRNLSVAARAASAPVNTEHGQLKEKDPNRLQVEICMHRLPFTDRGERSAS